MGKVITMDYGFLGGGSSPSVTVEDEKTTQVYSATHESGTLLAPRYRSFISFSFGGKNIEEEWNLISVTPGDRIEREIYSTFEDLISESQVIDGHFYWGTHEQGRTLTFTLATDEMTEAQLADFQHWFAPGQVRELILAEVPNRAIQARVSEAPTYAVLAFEKKELKTIAGEEYEIPITAYRGRINISFTSESPYWYARNNIITEAIARDLFPVGTDEYDMIEVVKAFLDDGTIFWKNVGGEYDINSMVTFGSDRGIFFGNGNNALIGYASVGPNSQLGDSYIGPIIDELIEDSNNEVVWDDSNKVYFYYPGTAPGKPILEFVIYPVFNSEGYIIRPYSSEYTSLDGKTYNTIKIMDGDTEISEMRFTLPSLYSGYNTALKIFKESSGKTVLTVKKELILMVREYYSRAYAMHVISSLQDDSTITDGNVTTLTNSYMEFLSKTNNSTKATFLFDSKDGYTTSVIDCGLVNETNFVSIKENAGDMMRSNYLLIDGRKVCDNTLSKNDCFELVTDYFDTSANNENITIQSFEQVFLKYDILYR